MDSRMPDGAWIRGFGLEWSEYRPVIGHHEVQAHSRCEGTAMPRIRILLSCLVLLLIASPTRADDVQIRRDLAIQMARAANLVMGVEPTPVDLGIGILQEAAQLDPDNAQIWHQLLDVALYGERDDVAQQAVTALSRLEPNNDAVALLRLNMAIARAQTVEDRIAMLQRLLAPAQRSRLTPAMAGRLAHDLALLYNRNGEMEQYARWLAESVAIDPANAAVAQEAAGYFAAANDDPFAQAELLTIAMLADPTDMDTLTVLAEHLLEHGAFVGAARLYTVLLDAVDAEYKAARSAIIADQVLALWGMGDTEQALRIITRRQIEANRAYRQQLQQQNPELTLDELATRTAVLQPTMMVLRAAMLASVGDTAAPNAMQRLIDGYTFILDEYRRVLDTRPAEPAADATRPDPQQIREEIARNQLELASILLWLGGDAHIELARGYFDQADQVTPVDDAVRQRFEGWFSLRLGEYETAMTQLEPLAADDPAALLGVARIHFELGQRREAARRWLDLARRQPGTVLGVWANDRLVTLLGQRTSISDVAAQMESLIATVPSTLDRLPANPTLGGLLRVTAVNEFVDIYDPMRLEVTLINAGQIPLTLDSRGPIMPEVILTPTVRISNQPNAPEPSQIVVDMKRRLRLEPNERVVVVIDLRMYDLSELLLRWPMEGALISFKGVSNPFIRPGGVVSPGLMGMIHRMSPFRVVGKVPDDRWIAEADAMFAGPITREQLHRLAVLARWLAREELNVDPLKDRTRETDVAGLIAQAYPKLTPDQQAWLLCVIAPTRGLRPVRDLAAQSDDRLVQWAYLMYQSSGMNDPLIDRARRSDDPLIAEIGAFVHMIQQRAARP
jgi:tetratricopeptide (TPR) repeat protein